MSIYKKVMGDHFSGLHPKLQERYSFENGSSFFGKGKMKTIQGTPKWLYPIVIIGIKRKLLFPEHGQNILFSISNTLKKGVNGEEQVHWERIFYFKNGKKRFFNALMSLDEKRNIIKDYLGEPAILYSDLQFTVKQDGSLTIHSKKQRMVIGRLEISLPRLLQGQATITEGYCEKRNIFTIHVKVFNPIIGQIFSYEGEFTSYEVSSSGCD